MKPSTTAPAVTVYDSAQIDDPEPIGVWTATIMSLPESALLARILQKTGAAETRILHVRYDAGEGDRPAQAEVRFRARRARAESIARQWEKIVTVRRVTLSASR